MFESAELGHKVANSVYKKREPDLRMRLLDAQYDLLDQSRFPVIILINGVDGAGKGETVNLLNEWMDPRHIQTQGFPPPNDEELSRPRMWRFWRALPPRGRLGIFFGSWYTEPILQKVAGAIDDSQLDQRVDEIVRFERMLTNEGALVLKFWFHLSKATQRKRLKALEKDPDTRWRVSEAEWEHFKIYDKFRKVCDHVLRQTGSAHAPWRIVEGLDANYRSLTVGDTLLAALRERLDQKPNRRKTEPAPPLPPPVDGRNVIVSLDYSASLSKKKYNRELEKWQGRLNLLSRHKKFRRHSVVAVFEGSDAAGKGGAIRRVVWALDARYYQVVPIAAPTDEERAQPYLWRFWRKLPQHGRFAIFDRSWYGRVLVERVENLCSEVDWMRAYGEINDFETQMVEHGAVVAKFWLAITKEEQLKRFKARKQIGYKRFKITEEDWRNRKKWQQYENAACDMIDRTSTEIAPWTVLSANDKLHARIVVLKTLCDAIEARI